MRHRLRAFSAATAMLLAASLTACSPGSPPANSSRGTHAASSNSGATPAATPSYHTISAIHALGTRRYSTAEIARASGLHPGQRFSAAAVHAAEERFAATGAFTEVNSLLIPSDNGRIVDFELTDNPHFYPVQFVGFGWSAARLRAELRATVPLFTGRLPVLRLGLAHQVQRRLQQLAHDQHWPGQVHMNLNLAGGSESVIFQLQR